jgi:GT2 family glycosyltransferase
MIPSRDLQSQSSPSPFHQVTVIVPVYDDYDATRACIQTLREELSDCRVVLVNDASPDKRLGDYLKDVATDNRIELIVNTDNIGFVASVNNALARTTCGDVLLLNSDTIVPKGLIKRLTAAARLSPDIGTVTPLSNNGEFVSFPLANQNNPWGSRSEVEKIDGIAARVNSGQIVDLPTGIGFCLYVTRACLERVGPLSENYTRGYLEDADFCLRARDQGFRNVCATSVYVGHAGSRSFGREKRSLVVRNFRILERRFPKYRAECAAFMAADPLCAARRAIERETFDIQRCRTVLVASVGVMNATAYQRAEELDADERPALILQVHYRTNGGIVVLKNAAGGVPQSLQFDLSLSGDRQSLLHFLKSIRPFCIEFLDPANTPFRLVDLLRRLDVPYRLYIADAGLLGRHNERTVAKAGNRSAQHRKAFAVSASRESLWVRRWREIAEGADRIIVPCPQAEAFAASVLPCEMRDKLDRTYKKSQLLERNLSVPTQYHLGLVPVRSCAHEQRLMAEIAHRLCKLQPDLLITVVGSTFDDLGLMRSSGAFVTGLVEANEFKRLVKDLAIKKLFISSTRAIFSHPVLSTAADSSLPIAYFDWSEGRVEPNLEDLAIDPSASVDDVARSLDRWLSKP